MTMTKEHISSHQKYFLALCALLFFSLINEPHCVDARVRGSYNIFTEESNVNELHDQYIVILDDISSAINNMTKGDISSLTIDMANRYELDIKDIFSDGLLGFTASNLTKVDIEYLQKEDLVLLVEKDDILSVDDVELGNITDAKTSQVKMNANTSLQTNEEIIPLNIQQVGWINAESDTTITNRRIFIIDSGLTDPLGEFNIDTTLARNFVTSFWTPQPSHDWSDCNGHGTHVASIIAARRNDRALVGVAAGALVVPLRVLDCHNRGTTSDIVRAINYVASAARPRDVVNLSLGGRTSRRAIDVALAAAAERSGASFVVAAGNDGIDAGWYSPARVDRNNVYTVCALDRSLTRLTGWSNVGRPPIDLCAPGTDIVGLSPEGGLVRTSGTSVAAPHVAGLLYFGAVRTDGIVEGDDGEEYKVVRKCCRRGFGKRGRRFQGVFCRGDREWGYRCQDEYSRGSG